MIKLIHTIVSLVFVASAGAQNFEGVIQLNTTNAEQQEEATVQWYLKDGNSRMDISSKAENYSADYSIISDKKGMDMVSQGHVTPVPQVAMKVDNVPQTLLSQEEGVQMNGYNCTKAVYFDGKNQTTYWLTNDLPISFSDIPFVIQRNMPKIKSTGFPIKMEKKSPDGAIILSQDVTSVKATSVSDSKFDRN